MICPETLTVGPGLKGNAGFQPLSKEETCELQAGITYFFICEFPLWFQVKLKKYIWTGFVVSTLPDPESDTYQKMENRL